MTSPNEIGEVARRFAVNLADAIGSRTQRQVEDATGVNHVTVSKILSGNVWPDLATIAKLERGLQANLWPGINLT